MNFQEWLYSQGMDPTTMDPESLASWRPLYENYLLTVGEPNQPHDQPVTTPEPPPVDKRHDEPSPPPPPPGGGFGANFGNILQPFTQQFSYQSPTIAFPQFRQAPAFSFPDLQLPEKWTPPTSTDVFSDPSYDLRVGEGSKAIQNSAAGRGLLRSGGTLSDILKYNQQFASNEYGNIWNRSLGAYQQNFDDTLKGYTTKRGAAVDTYNTNYGTQYVDPYKFNYQAAIDQQTQANRNRDNAWQQYLQDYDVFKRNEEWPYQVLSDQQKIGLGGATA